MTSGIIGGLVAAALLALLTWLANRKRPGAAPLTTARYGVVARVIVSGVNIAFLGVLVFLLTALATGMTTISDGWPMNVLAFPGLLAMGAVAAWAAVDAYKRRIDWTSTTARFRKMFTDRTLAWEDITSLDIRPLMQYARVGFRDGRGFAIFEYMTGASDFMDALISRGVPVTMWGKPAKLTRKDGARG